MADNLNVANNLQSGEDPPINKEPTQSPLEQSTPVNNPLPTSESTVSAVPSSGAQATPTIAGATVAGEANQAPPAQEQDMGESAPAPDTDEFLKSILQEQPQVATDQGQAGETTDQMPGEANPVNQPLQEQNPVDMNSPAGGIAQLNDDPLDQVQAIPDSEPAPSTAQPHTGEPTPMPEVAAEMESVGNMNQEPRLSDNISLDGVNTAPSITPMSPEPPQGGESVSTEPMPADEKAKNSPVKMIVLVVLVIVVLIAGYYAYSILFPSSSNDTSSTNSVPNIATVTATVTTGNSDSQRKADLFEIQDALLNYAAANNGKYPVSESYSFLNQTGNILETELVPTYLAALPADPSTSKSYAYKSDGTTFTLTAELDNANDPEAVMDSGKVLLKVTQSSTASSSTASTTSATSTATTSSSNADNATATTTVGASTTRLY